jgi:hypothetical protein
MATPKKPAKKAAKKPAKKPTKKPAKPAAKPAALGGSAITLGKTAAIYTLDWLSEKPVRAGIVFQSNGQPPPHISLNVTLMPGANAGDRRSQKIGVPGQSGPMDITHFERTLSGPFKSITAFFHNLSLGDLTFDLVFSFNGKTQSFRYTIKPTEDPVEDVIDVDGI